MKRLLALGLTLALFACSKAGPTNQQRAPGTKSDTHPGKATTGEETSVAGCPPLTAQEASRFVALSLECVDKEYPNKPSNILDGDETVLPPRELTPAFYGCFDWHSAVHGHWAMVRVLKSFPDVAQAADIRAALDRHLTAENLRREVLYFGLHRNRTFERPYGWAWLLRLHAELVTWDDDDARRWAAEVGKLAALLSRRLEEYLRALSVPVRAGTHNNTAFALVHALDAARATADERLEAAVVEAARRFYLADRSCPVAYEPSGEDFISPCLAEAELMARVLPPSEIAAWLDRFLPAPEAPDYAALAYPPEVRDRHDPKIGHLIGLMFQRAWSAGTLVKALLAGSRPAEAFDRLARRHCAAGVALMFDSGYGGSHWLASFALYLRTEAGPYPAPQVAGGADQTTCATRSRARLTAH